MGRRKGLAALAALALLAAGLSLAPATAQAQNAPSAPSGLSATPKRGYVKLSWTDPSNTSITGYEIQQKTGAAAWSSWAAITGSDKDTTSHIVWDLTNGTAYRFKIRAKNANGTSAASSEATAVAGACAEGAWSTSLTQELAPGDTCPITIPSSVTRPTFRTASPTKATVRYYGGQVTARAAGTATITGTVSASDVFTMTVTVREAPGKPTGLSASGVSNSATLTWTAPASGGTVTDYEYRQKTSGVYGDWTSTGSTTTTKNITGLTSANYTFQVRAANNKVRGASSNEASTGVGAPGKPTVEAVPGDARMQLWMEPGSGTKPTGYEYQYKTSGNYGTTWTSAGNGPTKIVTGLTNDTAYTFRIRATNSVGNSPASDDSTATPKSGRRTEPRQLRVTATGNGSVSLGWAHPAGSGLLSSYWYRYKTPTTNWTTWTDTDSFLRARTFTGLTNCTPYTFQIKSQNFAEEFGLVAQVTGTPGTSCSSTPQVPLPAKPTGLTATAGNAFVDLSWNLPSDSANIGSYELDKKEGTAAWSGWAAVSGSRGSTTKHKVSGLTNGTEYKFKIRAKNSRGNGTESDTVSATPLAPPGTPTALSGESSPSLVKLSWTAPASGGTVAVYEYRHQSGSGYTDWAPTSGAATSHTVDGLTDGTAYTFQVRGVNASGAGTASSDLTATPGACAKGAWGTSSLTQALAPDDTCSIAVPSSVTMVTFSSSDDDKATVNHTGVVTAKAAGTATISAMVSGSEMFSMALTVKAAPGKPTGLTAAPSGTRPTGPNRLEMYKVTISWTAATGTVTGYEYRQKTAVTGYSDWVSAGTGTSKELSNLTFGTRYTFQVRASNSGVYSSPSDPATTNAGHPGPPTRFTAEAGDAKAKISWAPPAWGGTPSGYDTWRDPGHLWTSTNMGTTTSLTVMGLTNGIEYRFRVRANNATGPSGGPDIFVTPASGLPDAPTAFTATAGGGQVDLAWTKPSGTITDHEYRYKTTADYGEWTSTGSADASHKVVNLIRGTLHTFQVRAKTSTGAGLSSAERTATPTTAPAKPTGFTATATTGAHGSVTLTWDNPNDDTITKYQSQQKEVTGTYTAWADITNSNASTTTHSVTGLTGGTQHTFKIRAVNPTGNSPESDEATATPTTDPNPPSQPPSQPPAQPPATPPATPPSQPPGSTPPGPSPSPPVEPSPPSESPPSGSPPPAPPADDDASTEDDEETEPEPSVEVRIRARRVSDDRIEFALQQRTDGNWGSPRRPTRRYFPPTTAVGRWLRSTTLNIDGQRLRIVARRLADRRVEFALQHRRSGVWSARILPTRRYFPATRIGRWLSSTPLWANPHQPRPAVCNRATQITAALAEAADKPCKDINGADLGAIEQLDLSDTNLRALRAADLGGLTGLTTLNLSDNRLSELAPGTLTHTPRLASLNLSDNRLTRFRTGALQGARQLTTLNLSSNRLTSINSRTLSDAPSLRSINLASNRINRLSDNTFNSFDNLRTLNLTGNPGAPFDNLNTPDNTNITQ